MLALWACPALAETTASLYVGASHTARSDVRIIQPGTGSDATFHDVGWDSQSFRNPIYYGIRVGRFFDYHGWGMGQDFTHDKVYARTGEAVQVTGTWNGAPVSQTAPMNRRVQAFNISHGVNILAWNVYYRWMLRSNPSFLFGRLLPYAGGGPTYYVLHAENMVNGRNNDQAYKGAGAGYQMLAGLHFRITQKIGIFIEAKYNSGKVEIDIAGGRGETTLNSSQLLGGLSYTF